MQVAGMEMVSNSVDYVTATCYEHKLSEGQSAKRFFGVGLSALEEEMARGNDRHPFKLQGFVGWSAGQATVGTVGQAVLVRLSGDTAERHFRSLYRDATNVSRIDVQGTYRMQEGWRDMSYVHLDSVRAYRDKYKPHLKVTRIDGGKHGNSLIIGSRVSDVWLRCYDKHAESKQKVWQDCWRYEAELKRRQAGWVAADLGGCPLEEYDPFAYASYYFNKAGVPLTQTGTRRPRPLGETRLDSDSKKLEWLRKAVAPTVALLISKGRGDEVEQAVFGCALTGNRSSSLNDSRIQLTKEEVWRELTGE